MASQIVRDWFRSELEAWAAAHPSPDPLSAAFVETINEAPDSSTMPAQWATLSFPPAVSAAVAIGQPGCKRESGQADIWIATKAGLQSDRVVMPIAEGLRLALRERAARLSMSPSTYLRTQEPQPPFTLEDAEGRWFFATVSVPYECDSFV